MKKSIYILLLVGICITSAFFANAEEVTIKGKVKFYDDNFKITAFSRDGFGKKQLGETPVNPDGSYELKLDIKKPTAAFIDCGKWQQVHVWLENENLGIDFRGLDTAKVKIKNPPFVYINGGKNNDLMNLINFDSYRNYQMMIAMSKAAYFAKFQNDSVKQAMTRSLYDANYENGNAYTRYYAEHYANCNSVMVAVEMLNPQTDKALIDATLEKLSKSNPVGKQLVEDYRQAQIEKAERERRVAIGAIAPAFTAKTQKGKAISPADFKGKVLVLDFWASWCGPCRAEIPNMKEIYADMKGKDVEFLSVSIDSDAKQWENALKKEAMPWKQGHVADSGKEVMDLYQFNGIPFIIVIDKEGKIYRKHVRGKAIRTAIEDCLAGKPAKASKSIGAAMM